MAEIEYEGIKVGGSKLLLLIPLLGTLGGGLWGGFEFYKDYIDMKEIIANIDTDAISARNDLIETKLGEAIDYTRDIKNDLRSDVMSMEDLVDRIESKVDTAESRIKDSQNSIEATLEGVRDEMNILQKDVTASIREVEANSRINEKDVRDTMRATETRIDEKMRLLERDLKEVLQEALDNPLAD